MSVTRVELERKRGKWRERFLERNYKRTPGRGSALSPIFELIERLSLVNFAKWFVLSWESACSNNISIGSL